MRRRQILVQRQQKEQEKTMTTSSATATIECLHEKLEYDQYSDTKRCIDCGAYWAANDAPKKKRGRPKRSE